MIPTLLRLLGIAISIALVMRWLKSRQQRQHHQNQGAGGLGDVVKNPDLWDSMNEHFQQRDRELEQAKHWSDDEIALAFDYYVFKLKHSDDDNEDAFRKLAQQPHKASEQALVTLGDPNLQSRLRKEPKDQPALYRACQVLMLSPSAHAAPQVRRLLAASKSDVKNDALRWLAQVADATYVDDLLAGLRSNDQDARWAVINGLINGTHEAGSRLAIDMFEPVATLLSQDDCDNIEQAAQLLLRWNREAALARFEQIGAFDANHNAFRNTLEAMLAQGEALPRQRLHELWQTLDSSDASKSDGRPVLQMLAMHHNDEDLPLLRQILDREHESASAAAAALLHYHGLQDWAATVAQRPHTLRSEAEQVAMAAFDYDCNVCNGGHTQFFFNSSGDSWQTALAALERAGDTARLEILREAIAKFPNLPSSNRDKRHKQVSQLTNESAEAFEDLDSRYYAVKQPADVTITRLVLATPEVFRA
ncbi:MAG: hypothetical protein ACI8UD_000113 [Planctomycetota bacterium]|jgi:hypothetical protein